MHPRQSPICDCTGAVMGVVSSHEVNTQDMTYPVRATFSTKLRPARFKGKV